MILETLRNTCECKYMVFNLTAVTGIKVILSVTMQQLHTTMRIKYSMGTSSVFFHDSEQSLVFCMLAKLSPCDAHF